MDRTGEHHVARIDDTVTADNLHARAEAVAVPDFNYLEQTVEAIAAGVTRGRRHRGGSLPAPTRDVPESR
ncbi:hypothetical protein Aab01nite_53940 [Paractinoplanes abujensis]|uniref:Uncharacterized protein n=1 Tax=Paractinoplanes abujensis TaxID=882441 RepID=A0A7W7G482_9ACTN|nr:hypothetical protein [Actinoplanes abujensis]MBB4693536.1 hypothetical protein [Actinoplanes abujensis]GID21804.1 hypothetical protein Aab01nite_53940 [Actinoplanes abujensis]